LQDKGFGPRASFAQWSASRTDDLSGASPELTGVCELRFGAAIERITTTVRVQSNG
jgi:hypothetical protein